MTLPLSRTGGPAPGEDHHAPLPDGRRLGYTELARFALQDIRAGGERVKPSCPFVADYMDRHPDTADLRAS